MGEAVEILLTNGFNKIYENGHHKLFDCEKKGNMDSCWYEEVIDDDLKWSFALNRFLFFCQLSLICFQNVIMNC